MGMGVFRCEMEATWNLVQSLGIEGDGQGMAGAGIPVPFDAEWNLEDAKIFKITLDFPGCCEGILRRER